jgi:antitoxin MazE
MRSQLVKWGNSIAIRVPKAVLKESGMQEGDTVEFGAKKGAILAKAVKAEPTLDDLVARITPDNKHEAVDWGPARGREVW